MCLHKIITSVHIVKRVGIFLNERWSINFKLFLLVLAEKSNNIWRKIIKLEGFSGEPVTNKSSRQ